MHRMVTDVISVDKAKELMRACKVNILVEKAAKKVNSVIEKEALNYGYVEIYIFNETPSTSEYYFDNSIQKALGEFGREQLDAFRGRLVQKYRKAGYNASYEVVNMDGHGCDCFEIKGFISDK